MVPELRESFNAEFTPEKYQRFLDLVHQRTGTEVKFRLSETPVFLPKVLLDEMVSVGKELVHQLVTNPGYMMISEQSIPDEFRAPYEATRPLFIQADFGIVRDSLGGLQPMLVEIQGFPSLYAFQPVLAECYQEVYELPSYLRTLLSGLSMDRYHMLMRRAIQGDYARENVVLLEIDPYNQKTLPDFLVTEELLGIPIVDIQAVKREGDRLYYDREGTLVPIHRIYNRVIVDELVRRGIKPAFAFTDELDVEWAGHPNWFFRMSKFSIPFLKHWCVPKTYFLDQLEQWPEDPSQYVLKPLYSFAGYGVVVGPAREQLEAIPEADWAKYILQERQNFEPLVETPHGKTQVEVRVMYIWDKELTPVTTILRMGRGKMMGVDHNHDLEWVGASAGFFEP